MGVRYGFQPAPGDRALRPQSAAAGRAVHRHRDRPRRRSRWWRSPTLPAAMSGSGWRTASISSRGVLAPSNAALVEKARRIVEDLGGQIASPARGPRHPRPADPPRRCRQACEPIRTMTGAMHDRPNGSSAKRRTPQGSPPRRCISTRRRPMPPASRRAHLERVRLAPRRPEEVLVEITAAAVNPSDVKAAIGPDALRRLPAHTGPRLLRASWSMVRRSSSAKRCSAPPATSASAATAPMRRISSSRPQPWSKSPPASRWRKPPGSACPSSRRSKVSAAPACREPGETVLVLGVNGKVGQAAAQIATWRGARVIGVVRTDRALSGPRHRPVEIIDFVIDGRAGAGAGAHRRQGRRHRLQHRRRPLLRGRHRVARQARAADLHRRDQQDRPFDIFAFYRGRHTYVGIDTLALVLDRDR